MLAVADASCSFESDLSSQIILQYKGLGHCAVVCSMLHLLLYELQICLLCATTFCVVLHSVGQQQFAEHLLVTAHDNSFAHAVRHCCDSDMITAYE